jgi:hypothetical protein
MHNGSSSPNSEVGPTSAIISLITLIVSFFDSPHVWLQNMTLIVSFTAGCIAIYVGIKRLLK